MPSRVWIPLAFRNRFACSLARLHIFSGVTSFMPISDTLALAQHLLYRRRIVETELAGPPLFILGHWRSGTTLLHELMGLDERYSSPTTFQCFAPWHFLLTENIVSKYGGWLIPNKRPMDNMKAGWTLPQEDEFALMNLGAPTPYLRLAFPNHEFPFQNTLGSDGFSESELARWKYLFDWFLKALTLKTQKPLILKSPPHTGRVKILRSMYPDAKFVHLARDPRKLFPSTMKLWNSLDFVQSLQVGEYQDRLKEFVLQSLVTMYDSFEADRKELAANQLIDVRYEDLAVDPVRVVREIYERLELGNFESIESQIQERSIAEREYQTNRFGLEPDLEREVMSRWADYAQRYGYTQ